MKASRYIVFSFLAVVSLASTVVAQVNDTYVIPAAANAAGAFGTRWMTQFSLFNPQSDDLRVSVVFLPTGGAQGIEALIDVPANSVAHSDNILGELFEVGGTGSLLVATFPEDNPGIPDEVIARAFLVTSNTFNNSSAGTFGQTIPGTWTGLQDFASDEVSAVAHGIRHIAREGWRTNVGAVNLGRSSVKMRVNIYDYDGNTVLRDVPFTIPPLGHVQDPLPVELDRGSLEFFIDDPTQDAVVFPYTSTIDQLSGDPTYQTPTLLASAKYLYGKKAVDPTAVGKKIDLDTARAARATARRVGGVRSLKRGPASTFHR